MEPAGPGIGYADSEDYFVFNDIDLTDYEQLSVHWARETSGSQRVTIRIDSPTGTEIGSFDAVSTPDWATFITFDVALSPISGSHNLYFVFTGGGIDLGNIDWVQLESFGGQTAVRPKLSPPSLTPRLQHSQQVLYLTPQGRVLSPTQAAQSSGQLYLRCIRSRNGHLQAQEAVIKLP